MHRVVVLALEGVYPFELGIPKRIFGAADGRYDVLTCTVDGRPVRSDADFDIAVRHGPEVLGTADTVVIPPFDMALANGELSDPLSGALALVRPGTRIVSICTGAFVLAAAGLLDGRPATTHWALADRFRRLFPRVALDPDVLFIDDGDVLTSAGAASGVDVCLHVVRSDHGSEVANWVARVCVVPPWRDGGQAQYIEQPVPEPSGAGTAATRQWALERLHSPLALADLAAHARMSMRTFARRFRDEVGVSPGRWLIQQRVSKARHLLESSDLGIDQVAEQVGFATATSLRQHMHAAIGVSPLAYRRTFRATR
ncbi:AraC family transcriptional regulator with amidase-like domain [Saccharopolyspora erythraea NRRL 2338]|uniref:AraC-family transcriptional regulator n=2 Tax=Saccharopolyspora erythraea TaxID=1836 RepID=A4FR18_SACEN|nr:helix-turn-helix domain-containing protein [Saccharopolyspora erythraea]EQD83919.1 AraC family transcriptional regulator [Saccharopolyspora erythraea D]PFG93095.1 AraC family transcriptional regulator with amidase-like domain [Saccharopolyspora erythraea NRRL 2338]QRK89966.1 helix-turn-helix domain-containing protein [Saccharopolyspora erythraea]CAM06493.1 AraC-family transcriptional regulator [Saccharopolyspora erythraea NRRL 2338]